jgi:hypothetical protein
MPLRRIGPRTRPRRTGLSTIRELSVIISPTPSKLPDSAVRPGVRNCPMIFVAEETEVSGALRHRLESVGAQRLKQITFALLREWTSDVAVVPRGAFTDFDTRSSGVLGLPQEQRFRLFPHAATTEDLVALRDEAGANRMEPIAVAPFGLASGVATPLGVRMIDPAAFERLCAESGVVIAGSDGIAVDKAALRELKDHADASLSLLNGLLWLRPLSRNRRPPALHWTGTEAHELFERCFFLTMITTFHGHGESWGTKKRGKPIPDGVLSLPNVGEPILYDCKAARNGFKMEFSDLRACSDYLTNLSDRGWCCPEGVVPRFLFASSEIHGGQREASFGGRQGALSKRVPGARLIWMRAPDLVRFGLAIERAEVTSAHRRTIGWGALLDAGNVGWDAFRAELDRLRGMGYVFAEAD